MPPKLRSPTLKRHTPGGAGVLRDGADKGIRGYSSAIGSRRVITLSRAIAACLRGFAKPGLMNKQQETPQRISLLYLYCAFKQTEALIHSEKQQVTFEGRRNVYKMVVVYFKGIFQVQQLMCNGDYFLKSGLQRHL